MTSFALSDWRTRVHTRLDELETVHANITGHGSRRRWSTEQLNGHLFVVLVGQFQRFARTLHDDALDWLQQQQSPLAGVLADLASRGRRLDRGNPTPDALSADFGKLGMRLHSALRDEDPRNLRRLGRLERAVALRNGIAHDDPRQITQATAGPSEERAMPTLTSYRIHRRAFNALATAMDATVADHLGTLASTTKPW